VREELERMPALHGDVPTGGAVMFPHSDVPVSKLAKRLLAAYKTVIAEGQFFGLEDHFRIGLGGDAGELRRGLRNLERAIRDLE
jgi:aspartate/methionine/tyrosine aminotransferase